MGCEIERKSPVNWRLYHLLDLEQPVTAKQVRWSFRKITLRHHFYQAYIVLSDPGRKSLYDVLGEDVLGFIHSGSWGPLIHMIGATGSILFYFFAVLLGVLSLLAFFVLLGLRADDYIAWSWMQVVTPLFVFVIAALIITLLAVFVSFFWGPPWEEGMICLERIPAVSNCLAVLGYAAFMFAILTPLKKDETDPPGGFAMYFTLPIAADVVYYLGSLVWRWPPTVRLQMEYGLNLPSCCLCYGFFLLAFLYCIVSAGQWLLIGWKIDRKLDISWYVTFVPLAVRAGLRILEAFMRSMVKYTIGIKTSTGVAFDTIGAFFFNGLWLVSLYFGAAHVTRGKEEVPMIFALIPVYAILLYLLFATFFTVVYLLCQNSKNAREERLNNLKWSPTELQPDDRGVPSFFRNFGRDDGAANWDEIDDDDDDDRSSVIFSTRGKQGGDYYDDVDSGEEENVFRSPEKVPRANTPYGGASPADVGTRPYATSGTPRTTESASTERPTAPPAHRDPHNFRPPPGRLFRPKDDRDDSEDDDEGEGDMYYEDGDDRLVTEMSSSVSSSAVFTTNPHSPRR